jgi:hypothetical protein
MRKKCSLLRHFFFGWQGSPSLNPEDMHTVRIVAVRELPPRKRENNTTRGSRPWGSNTWGTKIGRKLGRRGVIGNISQSHHTTMPLTMATNMSLTHSSRRWRTKLGMWRTLSTKSKWSPTSTSSQNFSNFMTNFNPNFQYAPQPPPEDDQ